MGRHRHLSGNVMEGRIANLIGADLRSSVNHVPKCLDYSWIGIAVVGFRVLFVVPQANSNSVIPSPSNQRDFVLKAFLVAKRRKRLCLDQAGELRNAVRLQM